MTITIDGKTTTIEYSGSMITSASYIGYGQGDTIDSLTITDDDGKETVYNHCEVMYSYYTHGMYFFGFRCVPESERLETVEKAAAQIDDIAGIFPEWTSGAAYSVGNRVNYGGKVYKVTQAHTAQADWTPDKVPALFSRTDGKIADFIQPTGAHDAYAKGAKVTYNGKVYESLIDANTYSPEAYPAGWREVTE